MDENWVDGCDFCEIARTERPQAEVVAQGARWIAFFPLEPATPGHTLVVPRTHVPDLWTLDVPYARDLMDAVVSVGKAVLTALEPEGMNLITSSGSAAEQTVFHLHLHVVPRWRNDGFGRIWPPKHQRLGDRAKDDLAERIRGAWVGQ